MPERARPVDTLRAATPLRVGSVTLLPIERVVLRSGRGPLGGWAAVAVEPHALVVREPGGVRVVALDAAPVSLERLRETIPELDGLLADG